MKEIVIAANTGRNLYQPFYFVKNSKGIIIPKNRIEAVFPELDSEPIFIRVSHESYVDGDDLVFFQQ